MSPSPESMPDEILKALRRILRRVTLHSRQLVKETGLTLPQLLCMRAIADYPAQGATQVELSRVLQLSQPTITGIVDRLERAGLVRRERHTSDRRKVSVVLTSRGAERVESLPTPLQETFVARLKALPAAEQSGLLFGLSRIVELMEAQTIDASPILFSAADVKQTGADD